MSKTKAVFLSSLSVSKDVILSSLISMSGSSESKDVLLSLSLSHERLTLDDDHDDDADVDERVSATDDCDKNGCS